MKWVIYLAVLGFFGAVVFGATSLAQGVEPRDALLLGLGFLAVFFAGVLFNVPDVLFLRFLGKRTLSAPQTPEPLGREIVPHYVVQPPVVSQPSNQPLHPTPAGGQTAADGAGERRRYKAR